MAAGATYEPIQTYTLASAAASITFSSIAASWTDLRLVLTTTTSSNTAPLIRFNSDSGTNYSYTNLNGDGSSASSDRGTNTSFINLGTAGGTSTTIPTFYDLSIFSYAGSTYKTTLNSANADKNGSGDLRKSVGLWRSTSAITSIYLYTFGGDYSIGTTATLYGIKAA